MNGHEALTIDDVPLPYQGGEAWAWLCGYNCAVAKNVELLRRCIDPLDEFLDDIKNDRASYEGYEQRQKRFDAAIADIESLLADLRRANS